ncbi:MAG: glycoside hydrolase family 2 TIM barrel-domain containing protein [Fimbriiglobus sp.]
MWSWIVLLSMNLLVNPPEDFLWIEGENPTRQDIGFRSSGWGLTQVLSGSSWLHVAGEGAEIAKQSPKGLGLSYDFRVRQAGTYRVYARLGYEFARSPFQWRVGSGEWRTVSPETLTTDLSAIADFAEVAWLELGSVNLVSGGYPLEIQIPAVPGKRFLFGLDCLCITPHVFTPNGPFRPGERWRYAIDYESDKATFEFPQKLLARPGERDTLDLGGLWQTTRFDEQEIQDRTGPIMGLPKNLDTLNWRGLRVPAERNAVLPDWQYSHRYLYRTRVRVPEKFVGRSFVLRFPNNSLMTTVWVNGQQVGFSKTPSTLFECDVTSAIKPGVNEIVVGIKDHYYALAKTPDGKSARYLFNLPPDRFENAGGLGAVKHADFPTMFSVRRSGILESPSLVVMGPVTVDDLFAMPLVSKGELTLETTVTNRAKDAATLEVRQTIERESGEVLQDFAPKSLSLKAGETSTFTQTEAAKKLPLWWPDDAQLLTVVTTILRDGQAIDERRTNFGYREWAIRGNQFYLNGQRWQGRADLRHNSPQPGEAAKRAVAEWRKNGQNMMRFWGERPWTGASQRETLEFFDRQGVAVRRSGIFDGQVASYQLVENGKVHEALFENWRNQLAAWIKAERNHPSVMIWSLENEITYINIRNFGWLKQVEPEIQKAYELVRQLDPTRPVMIDGGDALMNQSLPVSGNHYLEQDKRDYPNEAYSLDLAYSRHTKGTVDPWPISRDKPLFLGESYFANGSPPSAYAEVLGEAAFLGRTAAAPGVAKFARMLSEGYRTHGVAAFHFWFEEGPGREHYNAWQPVAALVKEWNTTFSSGEKVTRNVTVFNDTRLTSPITLYWLLQTKNATENSQQRGKAVLTIAPGERLEQKLELMIPTVPAGATVDGDFVLTCMRDGKEVFRDVKPVRFLGASPTLDSQGLYAYDPAKKLTPLLTGIASPQSLDSLEAIPPTAKVLLVGPDAVTPSLASSSQWKALAASGLKIVVFEQKHALHYQATPADLEPTEHTGRIAFPENPSHPILTGLTDADFFCWSGDHVVYERAYRKPTRSGKSLIQCDVELGCTPLVEVPVGGGLLVLAQMPLTRKPTDPVARRLTANMIRYAQSYTPAARPTVVVLPEADPRRELLARTGLKFKTSESAVEALTQAEIVIVDANAETLKTLAEAKDKVTEFTAKGGQLMVWNLTPEGLADFNTLVGFDHAIRPFQLERVRFPAKRDPLLAGLSLRDVALESSEKIYPWAGDRYPASDTFTHIVDLDDIAPFVVSEKHGHGWKQMTNGLTSADSWKFIFYHDQAQAGLNPSWAGTLPKTEEVTGLTVVINADYRKITKLRVVFDDAKASAITLSLKPQAELVQEFNFPAKKCKKIALEPIEWTDHPKPVIGIDNLTLKVKRPDDFRSKVIPLLNLGGLVRYPQGQGGLVLNMLRVGSESNPENASKKQAIVTAILRNLGAEFAAEKLLIPGSNLAFAPVVLGEKCNLYLTADKGWLTGQPSFGFFPIGEQKFQDVRFTIRDFKTSPLPAAIVLNGPSAPAKTPNQVEGIPVNRTADMLYFLHTFHPNREPRDGETKPVFEYIVKYTDGQTASIPISYGRQIGPWQIDSPKPLAEASLAWSAKFPEGPKDKLAAVYSFAWTNPRPKATIESISLKRTGDLATGTPVLFAITAASER